MRKHPLHYVSAAALCLLVGLIFGLQSCGPREAAIPPVAPAPSMPPPEPKPEPNASTVPAPAAPLHAPTTKSAPAPTVPPITPSMSASGASVVKATPLAPAVQAVPSSPPETKPATRPTAPLQGVSPVSDPGGEVAVKPAKAGLSRVGPASCKMCHKVQFASWVDTAHAKRMPPLDCESCHGLGSEYKAIATMKDPAKALAAGLVLPAAPFCATCHKRSWSDGMLKKAHAHKG